MKKTNLLISSIAAVTLLLGACGTEKYPFDLDKKKTEDSIKATALRYIPVDLRKNNYKKDDFVVTKICKAEAQSYAKDSKDQYQYFVFVKTKDDEYEGNFLMNKKYKSELKSLYEVDETSCERVE